MRCAGFLHAVDAWACVVHAQVLAVHLLLFWGYFCAAHALPKHSTLPLAAFHRSSDSFCAVTSFLSICAQYSDAHHCVYQ